MTSQFILFLPAGVEPTLYPTSELIRRMNAGEPLEDDEDKGALPRGKASWIGESFLHNSQTLWRFMTG